MISNSARVWSKPTCKSTTLSKGIDHWILESERLEKRKIQNQMYHIKKWRSLPTPLTLVVPVWPVYSELLSQVTSFRASPTPSPGGHPVRKWLLYLTAEDVNICYEPAAALITTDPWNQSLLLTNNKLFLFLNPHSVTLANITKSRHDGFQCNYSCKFLMIGLISNFRKVVEVLSTEAVTDDIQLLRLWGIFLQNKMQCIADLVNSWN